jgi:hypothetical protein
LFCVVLLATFISKVNSKNTKLLRVTCGCLGDKVTEINMAVVSFIKCWCSRQIIRAVISGRKVIKGVQHA